MRQVLTNMLYYLIREPRHLAAIRTELATIENIENYKALQYLTHLNAVIYETMRLNPPVPSSGLRLTPPEGISVNERFIPGGTTVLVPHYTLFRRMSNQ
jgi:cytochrome P450 family 628